MELHQSLQTTKRDKPVSYFWFGQSSYAVSGTWWHCGLVFTGPMPMLLEFDHRDAHMPYLGISALSPCCHMLLVSRVPTGTECPDCDRRYALDKVSLDLRPDEGWLDGESAVTANVEHWLSLYGVEPLEAVLLARDLIALMESIGRSPMNVAYPRFSSTALDHYIPKLIQDPYTELPS